MCMFHAPMVQECPESQELVGSPPLMYRSALRLGLCVQAIGRGVPVVRCERPLEMRPMSLHPSFSRLKPQSFPTRPGLAEVHPMLCPIAPYLGLGFGFRFEGCPFPCPGPSSPRSGGCATRASTFSLSPPSLSPSLSYSLSFLRKRV